MVIQRVSSLDLGYQTGDLSVYPQAKDTKDQLYTAKNNAETKLKQTLTYSGKVIIVEDNTNFPDKGLLRIGPPPGKPGEAELIYYDKKTKGIFQDLIRAFAGSKQNLWQAGSWVTNAVMAEHHNAIKDAIIQIEKNLGLKKFPDKDSLNGILVAQETRFLAPRPLFRAYPTKGAPPLRVRFQNFSTGPLVRFLWDFGDGTNSVEKHPIHTYQNEGIYTVKLSVITSLGAQGIANKDNYITVDEEEKQPFFYVTPLQGVSKETANKLGGSATTFTFVDQTDGQISQRYWIFDGAGTHKGQVVEGSSLPEYDPNIHTTTFVYDKPGEYEPSVLILFESQKLKRAYLRNKITVT